MNPKQRTLLLQPLAFLLMLAAVLLFACDRDADAGNDASEPISHPGRSDLPVSEASLHPETSDQDTHSIEYYYAMVEDIIRSKDIDVTKAKGKEPGQYSLTHGSARIWIDVWFIEKEGRSYFQVMSPVAKLNTQVDRLAVFEDVLRINDKLYNAAFTYYDSWLWLKQIRETQNLQREEANAIINRIGIYSDQYDDSLTTKYGLGTRE